MAFKKFGIDISAWQGNFNLANAKKQYGVEFVIAKGGGGDDGLYVDSRFAENYAKAKALGMPIGCYWFSRALNVTQAKAEAKFFYENVLKGRQFELPIYIDVENRTQLAIGKRALTDVVKTWLDWIRNKGYFVGIYSSKSFFTSYMYDSELKKYAHWIACWSTSCVYSPASAFGMWQFGGEINYLRSSKINGQTIDQNYMIINYEKEIKKKGLNGFGKAEEPVTEAPKKVTVNGKFDAESVAMMQKWLGTPIDGVISGQIFALDEYYPAITSVDFGGEGSPCVEALQKTIGMAKSKRDGWLGKETVKAWQAFLIKNGYDVGKYMDDGIFGTDSAKAMQRYMNDVVK